MQRRHRASDIRSFLAERKKKSFPSKTSGDAPRIFTMNTNEIKKKKKFINIYIKKTKPKKKYHFKTSSSSSSSSKFPVRIFFTRNKMAKDRIRFALNYNHYERTFFVVFCFFVKIIINKKKSWLILEKGQYPIFQYICYRYQSNTRYIKMLTAFAKAIKSTKSVHS